MRAGERDKRVTILAATTADDGRGGTVVTGWPALSPGWWVSIETLSAREFLQAGALQDTTTHLVRGLYRSDVTIKNRLYWGLRSLTFEIVARRELTTPVRELELECVEVDS